MIITKKLYFVNHFLAFSLDYITIFVYNIIKGMELMFEASPHIDKYLQEVASMNRHTAELIRQAKGLTREQIVILIEIAGEIAAGKPTPTWEQLADRYGGKLTRSQDN